MDVALRIRKLGYKDILHSIDLDIEKGALSCLLGPNGAGKTTLFRCILGMYDITGDVFINDVSIKGLSYREIAQKIAFVPQQTTNSFDYKVIDVVLMGRAPYMNMFSVPKDEDYEISYWALRELSIEPFAQKNFSNLSGGERQLVLIARAIAQQADILIFDEPTAHLDLPNQFKVLSCIKNLIRKGKTAFISLHDPNLAILFSNWIIMIKNGKILSKLPSNALSIKEHLESLYQVKLECFKGEKDTVVYPVIR